MTSLFQLIHRMIKGRRLPEIYRNYSSNKHTAHYEDVAIDGTRVIIITVALKATQIPRLK